jgi:hypothetical protein
MAQQAEDASEWIPTAERLPERGQYVNFVAEGQEEVLVGQFFDQSEGGGYFRDIIYGDPHHWKVLRWKAINLPPEEVEKLLATYEWHRQELRALMSRADTIKTAQLDSAVMARIDDIKRKLGATEE